MVDLEHPYDPNMQAPAFTRIEVPSHLKGYAIPQDFRTFFEALEPNIRASAAPKIASRQLGRIRPLNRGESDDALNDVVADLFLWFSGSYEDQPGVPRYMAYDPVLYPNIPFYRYILSRIDNIISSWAKRRRRVLDRYSTFSDYTYDSGRNAKLGEVEDTKFIDMLVEADNLMLMGFMAEPVSVEDHCDTQRFIECLDQVVAYHSEAGAKPQAIERNLIGLAKMEFEHRSREEMQSLLKLSGTAVSQWVAKLHNAGQAFRNQGPAGVYDFFRIPPSHPIRQTFPAGA